jgi:phage shock protein PspC (stress-responsive transcriptional regulator)
MWYTGYRSITDGGAMKRIYRSSTDRRIGGVCGGLGEFFDKDPTFFRLIFVLVGLLWGFGILAYLIMWLIIPLKPKNDGAGQPKGDR